MIGFCKKTTKTIWFYGVLESEPVFCCTVTAKRMLFGYSAANMNAWSTTNKKTIWFLVVFSMQTSTVVRPYHKNTYFLAENRDTLSKNLTFWIPTATFS